MWKIIKQSYQYLLALIIFVVVIILVMSWYHTKSTLGIKEWNKFKKQIKIEHNFIKDVVIYNVGGRAVFITYVMDNDSNLIGVKSVFEETKKFLLSEKIFSELEKYQQNKYSNDFYSIYIRFKYLNKDSTSIYQFESRAHGENQGVKRYENYKTWSMDKDGEYKDSFQDD